MSLDTTPAGPPTTTRRFLYALVIAVAAAQGLGNILTATILYSPARWPENRPPHSPMFSANDRSRWCTVWALAERGTYQIDEIIEVPGWDTIDKVRKDGHFYSSKPALLPTLVAGLYWALNRITGLDLLAQTHETVQVLLLVINLLPWLIALALLAAMGERYARTDWSRGFLVLAAAFGTLLTPFLISFNNHNLAATSVVFALYPTLRILIDKRRDWWLYALAGFWSAFAFTNELPAAAFVAALFVLLGRDDVKRTAIYFSLGAAIPIVAFLATTYASTGSFAPFYAGYGSDAYKYVIDGVPSYWVNPSGIDRNLDSPLVYFLHCTVGHHGIFSLTPVFLLTLVGWLTRRVWSDSPLRMLRWVSLGLTAIVLGFYMTRTANYNYGGVSAGLRWMFWLIPLWLVAFVPVLDTWGNRRWFRMTSVALLAVSIFSATLPHNNPWQPPWLQNVMEDLGWVDYSTPVESFPVPRRSWLGHVSASTSKDSQPWVEFTGTDPQGRLNRLRVESIYRESRDSLREIKATQSDNNRADNPLIVTLIVIEEQLVKGATPFQCIIMPTSDTIRFLSGLPTPAEYRPGSVRYLKTPLQKDAFFCRLATASVRHRAEKDGPEFIYRRTVWLTDEIPFGVAQFEDTVTDPRDNSIVFKQRLTATNCSGLLKSENHSGSK